MTKPNAPTVTILGTGYVGLTTAALLAAAGMKTYVVDDLSDQGLSFPDRLAVAAGFDCGPEEGISVGDINFHCDERREGEVALVNVGDLGESGDVPVTNAELEQVGAKYTGMLAVISDGAVRLQPRVYTAPAAVGKEVREHMQQVNGQACIDHTGEHTPALIAVKHMPELRSARYVLAFGGNACPKTIWHEGKTTEGIVRGGAHTYHAARLADIFSAVTGKNTNRAQVIDDLTESALHENLHLQGVDHNNEVICTKNTTMHLPEPSKPVDLRDFITKMLNDPENCKYSEYSDALNAVGSKKNLDKHTKAVDRALERVSSAQSDFVSGRSPSGEGARTVYVNDPGVEVLTARVAERQKPFGAVIPLEEAIEYTIPDGRVRTFTNVVLDYKLTIEGKDFLHVYLTGDIDGHAFQSLQLPSILIPESGRSLTFGDVTISTQASYTNVGDPIMSLTTRTTG